MRKVWIAGILLAMLVVGSFIAMAANTCPACTNKKEDKKELKLPEELTKEDLQKLYKKYNIMEKDNKDYGIIIKRNGIPEAGLSKEEVLKMMQEAQFSNFLDPDGKINNTKLNNFIDPVKRIVEKLKIKGYNENEIANILEKYGMIYYPETGATCVGRRATKEELKYLPLYNPTNKRTIQKTNKIIQENQVMEVVIDEYRGVNTNMKPGSCAINNGETVTHVITTHVGAGGHWTEAGVLRTISNPKYWLFTLDDDEGGYNFHGTTSSSTYNNYIIYVTDIKENSGYVYHIWIDDNWKRSGHLPYKQNDVNQANEVWSETGDWTPDSTHAIHKEPFLYKNDYAIWWNEGVWTNWWHAPDQCVVKERHYLGTNAWVYETWVE